MTTSPRFLTVLCSAALGAAAFAIAFRNSPTLWYRMALLAGNVVEAIASPVWRISMFTNANLVIVCVGRRLLPAARR